MAELRRSLAEESGEPAAKAEPESCRNLLLPISG
jgi:hypothetical protein